MQAVAALWMSCLLLFGLAADGWLGVYLADSDPPEIAEVVAGSPADQAGLKPGDRFLAVDGKAVTTREQLVDAVRAAKVGQRVRVKLSRNGSEMTVVVALGERPGELAMPEPEAPAARPAVPAQPPRAEQQQPGGQAYLGVALEQADLGLRVSRVVDGGPAAAAGIEPGDVLVKWGEHAVRDFDALQRLVAASEPGQRVALQLRSDAGTRSLLVRLGRKGGEPEPAAAPRQAPQPTDATLDDVTDGPAFATALAPALATGKPVLVLFGAAWNSASMAQRRAFAAEDVQALLRGVECVFLDTDANGRLADAHSVRELPQLDWMVGGKVVASQVGYLPPPQLARWLRARQQQPGAPAPRRPGQRQPDSRQPDQRQPAQPQPPAAPPAAQDQPDVARELQEIRRELRELRRLLERLQRD